MCLNYLDSNMKRNSLKVDEILKQNKTNDKIENNHNFSYNSNYC